jgi:hypothetical protein
MFLASANAPLDKLFAPALAQPRRPAEQQPAFRTTLLATAAAPARQDIRQIHLIQIRHRRV